MDVTWKKRQQCETKELRGCCRKVYDMLRYRHPQYVARVIIWMRLNHPRPVSTFGVYTPLSDELSALHRPTVTSCSYLWYITNTKFASNTRCHISCNYLQIGRPFSFSCSRFTACSGFLYLPFLSYTSRRPPFVLDYHFSNSVPPISSAYCTQGY